MARYMSNDATKLYRVVVVQRNVYDLLVQTIYGPYEYKRSAGYVKSYMTTGWGRNNIVDSWIEESEPLWVKSD